MNTRKYPACNVKGKGILNGDLSFVIQSLSAEMVRIKTDTPLKIKSPVKLEMELDSYLFKINISSDGVVARRIDHGYEIILKNLSEDDTSAINDLMKSSCDIG